MQIQDMILGVNIIGGKVSIVRINGVLGWNTLRNFLGSEDHLDWPKIDFNAAKIITVQDYNNNSNKM